MLYVPQYIYILVARHQKSVLLIKVLPKPSFGFAFANNFSFIRFCFYAFRNNCVHNIYCNWYELIALVVYASDHALAITRVPFAGENANVSAPEGGIAQRIAHGING